LNERCADCSLSWPRPKPSSAGARVGQAEYDLLVNGHDVESGGRFSVHDGSGVAGSQSRAGLAAFRVEEQ